MHLFYPKFILHYANPYSFKIIFFVETKKLNWTISDKWFWGSNLATVEDAPNTLCSRHRKTIPVYQLNYKVHLKRTPYGAVEFESLLCWIIITQFMHKTTLLWLLSLKLFLMLVEINTACEQTQFAAQLFKHTLI